MNRFFIAIWFLVISGCATSAKCVDVELAEGGQMMASMEGDIAGFSMPSGTVTITGPGHYRSWLQDGCKRPPNELTPEGV